MAKTIVEMEKLHAIHKLLAGACAYLVDHGKIELGTPQSRLLVRAYGDLAKLLD